MLPQLLSLVLLVGLTATALLLCFDHWGWRRTWDTRRPAWLGQRCDFCASYWLCAALLLPVVAAYLRLSHLGVTAPHTTDISFLFQATPLYARLLAALPVVLPAAAITNALYIGGRRSRA